MTKLEEIADAIYSALCGIGPATWDDAARIACTAIEAMREPTEMMKRLDESLAPRWSYGTVPPQLFSPLMSHTGASWEQMIDAILAEKPE